MNDKRLPPNLLSNEWDKVKCKGRPRKSWLGQMDLLKKELDLQDKVLDIELIKKPLIKESMRSLKWPYNINPNCEFIRN